MSPLRLTEEEMRQVLELERRGGPFLLWRGADGTFAVLELMNRDALTAGRRSSNDITLVGDSEASRLHARLERIGEDWTVLDDGLSRNGTLVAGVRINGRRRLSDGDEMRMGNTVVQFRNPAHGQSQMTAGSIATLGTRHLNATQRRVLLALSRPLREQGPDAMPATNEQIRREVYLGADAVSANLRLLYKIFEIVAPQNEKRIQLARLALKMDLSEDGGTRQRTE